MRVSFIVAAAGLFQIKAGSSFLSQTLEGGSQKWPTHFLPIPQAKENGEDWKEYRAKLVLGGKLDCKSWAYDAGLVIEKGSIALSKVEDTLGCHDLRQPYLHKCAVLLLDHDSEFTKGIVLNRPTNLILNNKDIVYVSDYGDEVDPSSSSSSGDLEWRMAFGGDSAGLYDETPELVFLHSISTDLAKSVSDNVLKGMYVTSHSGACTLIEAGEGKNEDFFVFYGFTGWDPGQLQMEVERGSWSMVAASSSFLWNALHRQRQVDEPRSAGLEMWQLLDEKIGNSHPCLSSEPFSDLILKEWANEMLYVAQDGKDEYCNDDMIFRALSGASQSDLIMPGSLVHGSSSGEPHFLLYDQMFHKSSVLIIQDDDEASVGLILNCPTTESFVLETPRGNRIEFPIRYGGTNGRDDESPLVWLQNSDVLRKAGIGTPVGSSTGVFSCNREQVSAAIDMGLPADFILVKGFSVWEKEEGAGGIAGQVMAGAFDAHRRMNECWELLLSQQTLCDATLERNLQLSFQAWARSKQDGQARTVRPRCVFESNVEVGNLADDALRKWHGIFLLQGVEYIPF